MREPTQPDSKPKSRRYQFHLWHLFVLMALVAIGCAWFACRMQTAAKQKRAVEGMRKLGGSVYYRCEFSAGKHILNAERPQLRNSVGLNFLSDVVKVNLYTTQITDAGLVHLQGLTQLGTLYLTDTQITDAGLVHLQGLTQLGILHLDGTQITDAGLVHLQGLTTLWLLSLTNTQVTDAGLVHLKGLTNLAELRLSGTQVTYDGVKKLRQALPNCYIKRY